MKRFIYIFALIFSTLFAMSSCSSMSEKFENELPADAMGTMKLTSPIVSMESRAVSASNFIVRILQGNSVVAQYSSYAKMPEIITLPVGEYSVEAYSPNLKDAAWDSPYYYGVETFAIQKNQLTEVSTLICYFSNIKVTIGYSEDLFAMLGSDVKVTVSIANGKLEYLPTNPDAAGYFKAVDAENTLVAVLTGTIDGQNITSVQTFTDVKAGEARHIIYSMKKIEEGELAEYGSVVIGGETFVVDGTCNLVDLGDISVEVPEDDIQDKPDVVQPEDKPADEPGNNDDPVVEVVKPTITGDGFDINVAQYPAQFISSGKSLRVLISSAEGTTLKDLYVEIDSETLTADILEEVGLATEFSLVTPGSLEEGLSGLKFPVGDQITSTNNVVFDITEFLPLLGIYGAAEHNFIMTATDSNDQVTTQRLLLITE